jgi:hypothetical protein
MGAACMRSESTNDHIVPRMYLKRFAVDRSGGPQIAAASVDTPDKDFLTNTRNVAAEKNFYWGSGPADVPTHDMESFLTSIENEATPAFRRIMDKGKLPTDNAFPEAWPPSHETRLAVAWWLAAQLVRTAPQRERLWRLHGPDDLEPPRSLRRADLHHAYIVRAIAPLAALLYARPWGIGFTSLCLLTSDVPVQVMNARDDDDPLHTAAYWDIYVPLDPHRFLYLPGRMHSDQRNLMRDHLLNLPGGLAIALNTSVVESSHRHVLWHPEHDPRSKIDLETAAKIRRSRIRHGSSGTVINYDTLDPDFGIERRWLDAHVWDSPGKDIPPDPDSAKTDDEVIAIAEAMMKQLEQAQSEFDSRRMGP